MSFMQPEIIRDDFLVIETNQGTEVIPLDVVGNIKSASGARWEKQMRERVADYVEGTAIYSVELRENVIGGRLSAPGYMDCTPWQLFDTIEEATEELADDDDDSFC